MVVPLGAGLFSFHHPSPIFFRREAFDCGSFRMASRWASSNGESSSATALRPPSSSLVDIVRRVGREYASQRVPTHRVTTCCASSKMKKEGFLATSGVLESVDLTVFRLFRATKLLYLSKMNIIPV